MYFVSSSIVASTFVHRCAFLFFSLFRRFVCSKPGKWEGRLGWVFFCVRATNKSTKGLYIYLFISCCSQILVQQPCPPRWHRRFSGLLRVQPQLGHPPCSCIQSLAQGHRAINSLTNGTMVGGTLRRPVVRVLLIMKPQIRMWAAF